MDTGFLIAGFHMMYGVGAPDKRFFPVLTRMAHFRSGSKPYAGKLDRLPKVSPFP